jgi:phage repressor protein C with HTH and peptisase S24 domain
VRTKSKLGQLPDWATQITSLRERLKINQAELARRIECSSMTVSRWERGLLKPSAENFIQLGNLGSKTESWFFWEKAGIQAAKMAQALRGSAVRTRRLKVPPLERAHAGAGSAVKLEKVPEVVGLPILKAVAGTHGTPGDLRSNLRAVPATQVIGAPAPWCPNPAYTTLLRVKGNSMEPLIRNGDILAVDSFQVDCNELDGKIIIASHEKTGLSVSRLRRVGNLNILESDNRQYQAVVLNRLGGWHIVGRVLWWISAAP